MSGFMWVLAFFLLSLGLPDTARASGAPRVELKKILDIEPKEELGSIWTDLAIDGQHRIYLLDGKQVLVDRFTPDGKWLGSRRYLGEGPGEIDAYPAIHDTEKGFWLSKFRRIVRYDQTGDLVYEKRLIHFFRRQLALDDTRILLLRDDQGAGSSRQSRLILTQIQGDKTEEKNLMTGENLGYRRLATQGSQINVFFDQGIIPDFFFTKALSKKQFVAGLMTSAQISILDIEGRLVKKLNLVLKPLVMGVEDRKSLVESFNHTDPVLLKKLDEILPRDFPPLRNVHLLGAFGLLVEKQIAARDVQYLLYHENGEPLGEVKFPVEGNIIGLKCYGDRVALLVEEDELTRFVLFTPVFGLSGK